MTNEEIRPFPTWATNMAVASRGCDHLKGLTGMDKWGGKSLSMRWFGHPEAGERFTPTLKGAASAKAESLSPFMNSLGLCVMSTGGWDKETGLQTRPTLEGLGEVASLLARENALAAQGANPARSQE